MIGIFLDIETNGLDPFTHRSLEIAIKLINLENSQTLANYEAIIYQPPYIWDRSSQKSLEVNGFSWQKVASGKGETTVCKEITELFNRFNIKRGNALFICQNPSFDRAFFTQIVDSEIQEKYMWPYHWLDLASMFFAYFKSEITSKDPFSLKDGLSKDEIASRLNLSPEAKPHRAINGVDHLFLCFNQLLSLSGSEKKVNAN